KKRLEEFNIKSNGNLKIIPPLNYIDFLNLQKYSGLVITDSGGIQEETTVLGVPCITVRPNTERPITEEIGTNVVLKERPLEDIIDLGDKVFSGKWKKGRIPELWDGKAGERIAKVIYKHLLG
ncbi:UDP-N-acetylglucosamine 2-epimerase, partial [candidate division WOR-3 bacterium]|nr:UDP-N-acetylglucosamine 2-epimerase [candidate division WOR-3 bacterium]